MAKGQLPRIDDAPIVKQQEQAEAVPTEKPIETYGYKNTLRAWSRVDIKHIPVPLRIRLREKLRQLEDTEATLADGTLVTDKTKAVLWILENEVDD